MIRGISAMFFCLPVLACAVLFSGCNTNKNDLLSNKPLSSIVTKNKGCEIKTITDSCYSYFFKEGNAEEGVCEILKNGKFYINTFPIPVKAGDYSVNGKKWISFSVKSSKWLVWGEEYDSYPDATLAAVKKIPAGLEMKIYDNDSDGFADEVQAYYLEALIVNSITFNDDGSCSIQRLSTSDYNEAVAGEGNNYDGILFSKGTGQRIPLNNYDSEISPGDVVLVYYSRDGWAAIKAEEVKGRLISGKGMEYFQIENRKYEDACGFSRENLIISNRCTEFFHAMEFFGFTGENSKYEVSLWMVPTLAKGLYGAPAGFTTDENTARGMLENAVMQAEEKFKNWNGSMERKELNGFQISQVRDVIENSRKLLTVKAPAAMLNYELFVLYLALNGVEPEVTAKKSGFNFKGIMNN